MKSWELDYCRAADKAEPPRQEIFRKPPVHGMRHFFGRKMPGGKRLFDITVTLVLLILLSPLMLAIALYIKLVSPGPALFPQKRIGYRGEPFTMWKFRSMHVHTDDARHCRHVTRLIRENSDNLPMDKLEADPLIIPGGRFIRKTCFDELPQLFNVLRGDMSLIGPRPAIPYEVEQYERWHLGRFDCRPGMTGLWQVSGKNTLSFRQMVRLDIRYVRTMSPWLDFKILIKTIPAIVRQCRRTRTAG